MTHLSHGREFRAREREGYFLGRETLYLMGLLALRRSQHEKEVKKHLHSSLLFVRRKALFSPLFGKDNDHGSVLRN
jgi:hypothetical protein